MSPSLQPAARYAQDPFGVLRVNFGMSAACLVWG
jgi:hypothetical protein